MKKYLVLLLSIFFVLSFTTIVFSANLEDYQYVKKINYPVNGFSLSATQSNFPLCVHINSSSWPTADERTHFAIDNTLGKRVQFFDYLGTTNLPYEVEYYNGSTEAVYWVKVPSVVYNSDTNNYFWIAYGNDPNGTDQDNPTAVWDSNFKMVQHLGDNSWGASPEAKDSTSNANNGTNDGSTDATGQVRQGRSFDATDDYITHGDILDDVFSGANKQFTLETYINQDALLASKFMIAKIGDGPTGGDQRQFDFRSGNTLGQPLFMYHGSLTAGNNVYYYPTDPCYTASTFYHMAMTYDGTQANEDRVAIYVNGASKALTVVVTGSPSYIQDGSAPLAVGAGRNTSTAYVFNGDIDEIRISTGLRSADWIKLEYYSMLKTAYNGDSFITYDSEEINSLTSITEYFLDTWNINSYSDITFEVNRPTKYVNNPIYGIEPLDAAIADDGGAMTDETTQANENTANDMVLLPSIPAVNDAYYFGKDHKFTDLPILMGTVGVGTWTITWEYWDGDSWEALANVSSSLDANAVHFKPSLARRHDIAFDQPADWATTTINSQGPYYYIRARVSTYTSIVTQPKGSQSWPSDAWARNINYVSVYRAIDRINLFYGGGADVAPHYSSSLAYSFDGYNFIKTGSHGVTYRNSTDNNLLFEIPTQINGIYYNPDAIDPNMSYIGILGHHYDAGGNYGCVIVINSADGITFSTLKVLVEGAGESKEGMSFAYSEDGRGIAYYQYGSGSDCRVVGAFISNTSDLTGSWTDLGTLIPCTESTSQHYRSSVIKKGDIYLMFVSLYNSTTELLPYIQLYISRNGINWTFLDSQWIELGAADSWDDSMLLGSNNLMKMGDDWFYYYTGHADGHAYAGRTGHMGLATIEYERIGDVTGNGGIITSWFFDITSKVLLVNFDASGGGDDLQVELLDADEAVITGYAKEDCDSLAGINSFSKQVTWNGNVLPNDVFKIKFYLTGSTKLYSYKVSTSSSIYSKSGSNVTLPTDDDDLINIFTSGTTISDDVRVSQAGTDYVIFQFKEQNTDNSKTIVINWEGQSDIAPSVSPVYIQIYNYNKSEWENVLSDWVSGVGADFNIKGRMNINSKYYDSNFYITCRVYQDMGESTGTLQTDYWNITFLPIIPQIGFTNFQDPGIN